MNNNIITVYELLGLIKDLIAPKNIIFDDLKWEYDYCDNDYYEVSNNILLFHDYLKDDFTNSLKLVVKIDEKIGEWEDTDVCRKDEFLNLTTDEKLLELFIDLKRISHNQKYLKERIDKNE